LSTELLWFLFLILNLSAGLVLFALFKKTGLLAMIIVSIIACNIQVTKTIELFGLVATLGNVMYAGIFWATDVISEVYGKRDAKRAVWVGFASLLLATASMQVALLFEPHSSDFVDPALKTVFGLLPRIAGASLAAYLLSQFHDVWAFHFWRKRTGTRYLWLRNNLSTLVSQALDSIVFSFGAFLGVFSVDVVLQIVLTTYLLKFIVAALDTPFIYAAVALSRRWQLLPSKPH
jgi:queuosine precursor transporter